MFEVDGAPIVRRTHRVPRVANEEIAFPTLDASQLAFLESIGERRTVEAGEYLYRAGDATYDFFVIVSGAVEILLDSDGEERLITQHGAGRFLGELNMLTGQRVYVSARITEPGEVIQVPADEFRRVISTNARLGDTVLTAFMARRDILLSGAAVLDPGARLALPRGDARGPRVPHPQPHPARVARPRPGPGDRAAGRAARRRVPRPPCRDHVERGAAQRDAGIASPSTSGSPWVDCPTAASTSWWSARARPGSRRRCTGASEGLRTLAPRDARARRTGGHELTHRELPRLPDRHLRR